MSKNTSEIGCKGEEVASRLLKKMGYRILCRNFRTKYAEIDIVALKGEVIYFIEVKVNSGVVIPLRELVDHRKVSKIKSAISVWSAQNDAFNEFSIRIVAIHFCSNRNMALDVVNWVQVGV